MTVVETFELAQGVEQVALVPDQGAVQQLASAGLHSAFRDRFHPRRPDSAEDDLDACVLEDCAEQVGELSVAVPDQEPGPVAGVLEVHGEILRGLRHP